MADETFFGGLADLIAIGALCVSIWSARHATGIEKRLRKQEDKRSAFDQWIQNPVEAKLSVLDQCVHKTIIAFGENSKKSDRVEAIRKIQSTEFDIWFIGLEALCDQQGDKVLVLVKDHLLTFVDEFLDHLNSAQAAGDDEDLSAITRAMIRSHQAFVSQTKAQIQSARLAIK